MILTTVLALCAAQPAAALEPSAMLAAPTRLGAPALPTRGETVAQALDTTLSSDELEDVLYIRRAAGEDGRDALRHLAERKLLEQLAVQNGLVPDDAELEKRIRALDQDIKKAGDMEGLAGHMKKARVSREEFKRVLGLGIVQETLTRRALGLKDDKPVTGDQQKIWIEEELSKRGFQPFTPPWKDGIAARAADFTITGTEFLEYLRQRLPADTLREDCYQLLLAKRMLARMPDLAPEKLQKAIQDEIQRRRDEAKLDPKNRGIGLDQILAAQGIVVDRLADDPAVRISALSKIWVERSYEDVDLKRTYENERALFDGLYGPAHEVGFLFLRGAGFKNQLNPRTFDEAEKELAGYVGRARSREEFRELAKQVSEDADSKAAGGELGWVGPLTPKVPREVREEVTRRLALPESGAQGLAGPLRLPNGACLVWIGRRRPAPTWPVMSGYVKAELRRRFVEDVLPRSAVVTVFEGS